MDKKVMSVAVVAVLIVVAVSALFIMRGSDDNGGGMPSTGALEIYGNANGDRTIDGRDVDLVKDIIKNDIDWKTKYPFADANNDGKVDSADIAMIESIIGATSSNQVRVYYKAYSTTGSYVDSVRYPIVSAMTSVNQTTIITLKSLGIVDEIKAYSYSSSFTKGHDKYVYSDYEEKIGESTRMGASNTSVDVDKASQFVSNDKCTAYIYSSSNAVLPNKTQVEQSGIDLVQVADGVADLEGYTTALLILGYLFGGDHYDKAVSLSDWMTNYCNELNAALEPVYKGDMHQLSAVASSMKGYISVKGSSNTNIIENSGLTCPLSNKSPATGSTSTMTYTSGTDTWLNYVSLDTVVALKGSTTTWSWFDKAYDEVPSDFAAHLNAMNTLQCFLDGKTVIVSTMIPGPLKAAVIAQHFYPDCFVDGWAESKIGDFLKTYWGFTDEQVNGQKYLLTQSEVLGS